MKLIKGRIVMVVLMFCGENILIWKVCGVYVWDMYVKDKG